MSLRRVLALSALALPMAAQTWDLRLEVPFPKGQNLPQTLIQGTQGAIQTKGQLDTGNGFIASYNHRIIRVGPVLRLDWGVEVSRFAADGTIDQGTQRSGSRLQQAGFGVGLNAQLNVPFTGLAGEIGLIQRFQNYTFEGAGAKRDQNLNRLWLRVGTRYNLPLPLLNAYLAASYQQPTNKDKPVQLHSLSDFATYLQAQGSGQEVQRMWTFGLGIAF